jgi:hypothetical protein
LTTEEARSGKCPICHQPVAGPKPEPEPPASGTRSASSTPSGDRGYSQPETVKKRHGCVTVWLLLIILLNTLSSVTNFSLPFVRDKLLPKLLEQLPQLPPDVDEQILKSEEALARVPTWIFMVSGTLALVAILSAMALLAWKKVGFYGICVVAVTSMGLNMVGGQFGGICFGLMGIIILYAILQLGTPSAWSQLE